MSTTSASSYQDELTVLTTCHTSILATKRVSLTSNGYSVKGYGSAKNFSFRQIGISSFFDLCNHLNGLTDAYRCCLVRGKFIGEDPKKALRRVHATEEDAATIAPKARRWFAVDFDDAEVDCDPLDGPSAAAQLRSQLPEAFHNVSCWWSHSSSAGIKPGARMRMVFWLDKPLTDALAKFWMLPHPVDITIYNPAQPLYIASPIFEGCEDPVTQRCGVLSSTSDTVKVPKIDAPDPKVRSRVSVRSREWKWTGAVEYLDQILDALGRCKTAELNDFGSTSRHHAVFEAALRLGAYWRDCEIEPQEGAWLIQNVAVKIGLSEREATRIINNGFRAFKPLDLEGTVK